MIHDFQENEQFRHSLKGAGDVVAQPTREQRLTKAQLRRAEGAEKRDDLICIARLIN